MNADLVLVFRLIVVSLCLMALVPICGQLLRWRSTVHKDRYLYLALGALVISTGYGAVESILMDVEPGLRTLWIVIALAFLLVYLFEPFAAWRQTRKATMSDSTTPLAQPKGAIPWWTRFTTLEPALLRAITTALVVVLATVGLDAAGFFEQVNVAWAAIFAVIPLVQGWWTRGAVTSSAQVVEKVEPGGDVVAGPANDLVETGAVVRNLNDATPTTTFTHDPF